jgi:hypothetical protein
MQAAVCDSKPLLQDCGSADAFHNNFVVSRVNGGFNKATA